MLNPSIHVVVQQARFSDGSRRIVEVSELVGIGDDGAIRCEPIAESCAGGPRGGGSALVLG